MSLSVRFSRQIKSCEDIIGYVFTDKILCAEALNVGADGITHYVEDGRIRTLLNNKHLAKQGEVEALMQLQPGWRFTSLGKRLWTFVKAEVMCDGNLAEIVLTQGLRSCMIPDGGSRHITPGMMAITLRAIFGAVYSDGGGDALDAVLEQLGLSQAQYRKSRLWEVQKGLLDTAQHDTRQQNKPRKADEALKCIKEPTLLEKREEAFISYMLGCKLFSKDKLGEAEVRFGQAARDQERLLGQIHEDTVASLSWHGRVLYDLDRYDEAEKVLRQALKGHIKLFGEDHVASLVDLHNLGMVLFYQGNYSEAETAFRQCAPGLFQEFDLHQLKLLSVFEYLCSALFEQGKDDEAEREYQKVIERRKQLLGEGYMDSPSFKPLLLGTRSEKFKA